MKLAAVAIYWVIVALWLAVLATIASAYIRDPKRFSAARTLLIIVAIDTIRNLIENGYFGVYFAAQYGFFSSAIADILGDPRFLILPKVINVIAASSVLGLMVLRWLPNALAKHEQAEQTIEQTSAALRHEEEERRRLFDSSIDLILITGRRGNIVRASPSSLANLGYAPAEMIGRNAIAFIHPDDLENTRAEMRSARTGRHTRNFESRYLHKDGRVLIFAWSGVWSEPEQRHFFFGRDITDNKLAEEKLRHLAHFDDLTGIANRVTLQEDLQKALSAPEQEHVSPTSVILLDLDGFKDVNDTLGHSVGDDLLRQVAARLARAAQDQATLYRLGGDEFVLAVRNCGDPLVAGGLADKALKAISEPMEISGEHIFIGASAGIAVAPNDGSTVDELIASADLALYDAKNAGGKVHRHFVPTLRAQAQARRALDGDLRRAFAAGEFEVFFQPQIRVRDQALLGAEALLRWRHPERGLISPGAFIEALAKSAVSLEVGRWVLQAACAQAARWQRFAPFRIGVNLFPAQFSESTILEDIGFALDRSGLPPSMLEIEITENIALRRDDGILTPLRQLRERGVGLAFDDFGTGFASLSYLRRYPLTRLKIDKSFVQKLDRVPSRQDASLVRSIINMAHNLDLEVIAEGVETASQAEFLRAEGCDEIQGFLYGKPMPASEFERLFQAQDFGATKRKLNSA